MSSDRTKKNGQADPKRLLREAALSEAFLRRAEQEGLLDVAYAEFDSPIGRLLLAATPRGLVRITFPIEPADKVLEQLAASVSPRILESPAKLDEVRRELDRYFEGRLQEFDLPLDWQLSHGFYRKVLRAAAHIPAADHRSLPSRAAKRRSPGRLWRRRRGEADTAGARGGAAAGQLARGLQQVIAHELIDVAVEHPLGVA